MRLTSILFCPGQRVAAKKKRIIEISIQIVNKPLVAALGRETKIAIADKFRSRARFVYAVDKDENSVVSWSFRRIHHVLAIWFREALAEQA